MNMPRAIRFPDQPSVRKHYICHCERVGEEEIAHAILSQGARTVQEVVELTRAMQSCNHASPELMESACCYDAFSAACQKYFQQLTNG